ncbi:MAG: hypothetical protein H7210_01670, partial [Pyrinomonadaceae bacterium]|nr:hypothetical protein [Phycisphaerales bacterium]
MTFLPSGTPRSSFALIFYPSIRRCVLRSLTVPSLLVIAIAACAMSSSALAQGMGWLPNPTTSPAGGSIGALTAWDPDGSGPRNEVVVAAGTFDFGAGPQEQVATWDGAHWTPLGGVFNSWLYYPGWTHLLVFDPDDAGPRLPQLVISTSHVIAVDGVTLGGVAVWNGKQWTRMGDGGPSGAVVALGTFDPDGV